MSAKGKLTNAQKNASYPVTTRYLEWQAECRKVGACEFEPYAANHRFANSSAEGGPRGHFWLNADYGAIYDCEGRLFFSQR